MKIGVTDFDRETGDTFEGWITEISEDEGEFGPQLKWVVATAENEDAFFWTGTKLSEKSKLGRFVKSILGVKALPDDGIDTDDLLLQPVSLLYGPNSKGTITVIGCSPWDPKDSEAPSLAPVTDDEAPF